MILVFSLIFLFLALIACHISNKMNDDGIEGFGSAPLEFTNINKETSQQLHNDAQRLEQSSYESPADQDILESRAAQLEKVARHTKDNEMLAENSKKKADEEKTMISLQNKLQELVSLSNQAKEITKDMEKKF